MSAESAESGGPPNSKSCELIQKPLFASGLKLRWVYRPHLAQVAAAPQTLPLCTRLGESRRSAIQGLRTTRGNESDWACNRLMDGQLRKWHNVAGPVATKWACIQVGLECICRLGWKFIAFAL